MPTETGQRTDQMRTGRFSQGIEQLPDTPEKQAVGRFSRGVEHARNLVRYRIVDDRDGRVLAEYADAELALRSFGRLAGHPQVRARVSVAVLDRELGRMADVTSIGSMRACRHPERE